MSDRREQLEQQLLSDPFDVDARFEYATLLLGQDAELARQQFALLTKNDPKLAQAHVGLARALVALGQQKEALASYRQAQQCSGFEPDEQLEELDQSVRAARAHLQPVASVDNVVYLPVEHDEKIRFADVAGMEQLKKTLRLKIIEPFLRPGLFQKFRKEAGGGVLLFGPPGCGKTMMARAIATECNAAFLSVGISDVLSMWIGQSESNLGLMFEKARQSKPCVMFFDELDALAYSRSKASSEHTRTVVNEFLAQLDGFNQNNREVMILAATNMPWDVDPAMKRPGRFSRQVFVPPPDAAARAEMLAMKLRDVPAQPIDHDAVARVTAHFSGADMDGLIDRAKEYVLEEIITSGAERELTQDDLVRAVAEVAPSTFDWLRTARNLIKYAGGDPAYKDVERYLRKNKIL